MWFVSRETHHLMDRETMNASLTPGQKVPVITPQALWFWIFWKNRYAGHWRSLHWGWSSSQVGGSDSPGHLVLFAVPSASSWLHFCPWKPRARELCSLRLTPCSTTLGMHLSASLWQSNSKRWWGRASNVTHPILHRVSQSDSDSAPLSYIVITAHYIPRCRTPPGCCGAISKQGNTSGMLARDTQHHSAQANATALDFMD